MKIIIRINYLSLIFLLTLFSGLSCSISNSTNGRSYIAEKSNRFYDFSVSSIPSGASIYLDGIYQGQTPKTISVSDGIHEIEIKKDDYQAKKEKFSLDTNDRHTYTLKRNKLITDAESIITEKINKESIYYKYDVSSVPSGASIYLDGTYHGLTPKIIKVSDDFHEIEIKKEGHQIAKERFTLDKDETYTYVLKQEYQHDKKQEKFDISHLRTDNIPPEIVIYSHDASRGIKRIQKKKITIEGKATDESGIVEVRVDNKEAYLDSQGNFRSDVYLAIGENKIMVSAMDRYENIGTKSVKITRESSGYVKLKPAETDNIVDTEKRLALVIGNANYTHGGKLSNPVNDAISVKHALENLGFIVIKYENCTQNKMKRAVDEFGTELKKYDVALFFYAGHGVQVKGTNYLIPVDAKLEYENDAEYDCVRADRILAKMENAGSKSNIVILDACRDNPFERSWHRGAKSRGLAFMNAPSGSIIAYATSPGNTASDGIAGANGLYTSALLKHISTPNITIEEMFKEVRSAVMEQSGNKQTPWESTSLTGYFYFKKE